jgi:cytidylate kinase
MPIYWISGPPAAGKSTLCAALAARFERAFVIPVDDVRGWMVSGMADSVPWTDETERQFQIAEDAVADMARRYDEAGVAVLVDHCRNPQRLERVIQSRLADREVIKVCLMPDLDENLHRSHTRTNKPFDPHMLDDTIRYTNEHYRTGVPEGWIVLDNTTMSVDEECERLLGAPAGHPE